MQPGSILAGWNIGYSASMQEPSGKAIGFDLAMLRTRAEAYGLGERVEAAVQKIRVRDIGQEYAIRIAEEAVRFPELLPKELYKEVKGYVTKINQFRIAQPGITNEELAQELATNQFKMLGWKLEDIHSQVFPDVVAPAHQSKFDVESTIRLAEYEGPIFKSKEQVVAWGELTRARMLVNSAIKGNKYSFDEIMQNVRAPISATDAPLPSLEPKFQSLLQQAAQDKDISLSNIVSGTGGRVEGGTHWKRDLLEETSFHFGSRQGVRNFAHSIATGIKKNKYLFGIAAGAIGIGLLEPMSLFSGKDDAWNTIEGLPHGGLAEQKRRELTEFGSGWQGSRPIPHQLMGATIAEPIRQFREEVWDDPEKRREVERKIRAKEAAQQAKLGSFLDTDFHSTNLSLLEGLNTRNRTLKAINLERFNIEVEDADTLILKQKSAGAWFKRLAGLGGDIQVRLSGFDAPETGGHSDDPLTGYRIFQDQPMGQASAATFKQLIESQKNLTLIVSEGRKTYGRYLGAVFGDDQQNLGLELIRTGAVSALPFGDASEDVISRRIAAQAETQAKAENKGIWSLARYRAIDMANKEIGQDITYNSLTRLDKTAANLMLGAYTSYLETFGSEQRPLSAEEAYRIRQLGQKLRKTHGPRPPQSNRFSGKDDAHNTIEGLGHSGIAWQMRRLMTDFGSGWDALRALVRNGETFEQMLATSEFKQALQSATVGKLLGEGMSAPVISMHGTFRNQSFSFARKQGEIGFEEVKAMRSIQDSIGATVYSSKYDFIIDPLTGRRTAKGTIDMELFEGKTFSETSNEELGQYLFQNPTAIVDTVGELHKAGFEHADPHLGNLFLAKTPQGLKTVLLDMGRAKALRRQTTAQQMATDIELAEKQLQAKLSNQSQFEAIDPFAQQANQQSLSNIAAELHKKEFNDLHKRGIITATKNGINPGSRHRQKKY